LALFVSLFVYIPLFLWRHGNLTVDAVQWWKLHFHWQRITLPGEDKDARLKSSLALLAYPIAYFIIVMPISVERWITYSEQDHHSSKTMPNAAYFATAFLHDLFGAVNVLLLITTRPNLLLFEGPPFGRRSPSVLGTGTGTPYYKPNGSGGGRLSLATSHISVSASADDDDFGLGKRFSIERLDSRMKRWSGGGVVHSEAKLGDTSHSHVVDISTFPYDENRRRTSDHDVEMLTPDSAYVPSSSRQFG